MPITKPPGIESDAFKSAKWDELTAGRSFAQSGVPRIRGDDPEDEEEMMYLTKEQEDLILVREIERRDVKLAEKDAEIEAKDAEIERLKAGLAKKDRS